MAPRVTIIGGGSFQWVPKLLVDFANTPSLHDAEIVIEDVDRAPIPRMLEFVEHIADVRGIGLRARGTTDQRDALEGADYVVAVISTGGFASMRLDLEIPARYGIRQSVGDTVGPGGIMRAQRNVPVFLEIARDMEALCPDAWLLNLTNPMTTLCRVVTRESSVRTIGLCHEVTLTQFGLSLLLETDFFSIRPTVAGVNHLPVITAVEIGDGGDGLVALADLLDRGEQHANEPLAMPLPEGLGHERISEGGEWTKGDVFRTNLVKIEFFRRFGVLPAAGDRHLVEFFPGFLTEESGWGRRWGVELTSISDRERWQARYTAEFEAMLAGSEISMMPSGEMVAAVIDSIERDRPRLLPLNLPNTGQVADLPPDVVVESMGIVDGAGARGGEPVAVPGVLAEHLRRIAASQELVVEAAVTGSRDKVFEAMLADPLAGRIDYDALGRLTDEMLAATAPWLPQFDGAGSRNPPRR